MSQNLSQPDRAVKDIKTILVHYDSLVFNNVNEQCVNKVLAERSISQSRKLIGVLNYCTDKDKMSYLKGTISSTQLCRSKKCYTVACADQSLEERAKRLKDDSEIPLTVEMIMETFKGATANYLEGILTYIDMANKVKDNSCESTNSISQIVTAMEMVNQAITSFKEAIINNSKINGGC